MDFIEEKCGFAEIEFRISHKILNVFELDPLSKKPEKAKMVKMFVRNNAFSSENAQQNVRNLTGLDKTLLYLSQVLLEFCENEENEEKGSKSLYLFIHDRIKAIRQDLVKNFKENPAKSKVFSLFFFTIFLEKFEDFIENCGVLPDFPRIGPVFLRRIGKQGEQR